MANCYWVGGTGTWTDDDNHWATSSGGSGGDGNLPTSADNVIIDDNSGFDGGGTITLVQSNSVECLDFTSTTSDTFSIIDPDTEDPNNSWLDIYGSASFSANMSFGTQAVIEMCGSDSETITINGATIYAFNVVGTGTFTLQDDLEMSNSFYQDNGTFDANGNNVTAYNFYFYADTGYTPTVTMGSGNWNITSDGTGLWTVDEYNSEVVTIIPETSTIRVVGAGASGDKTFDGGSKTYYNINLVATEADDNFSFKVTGSNTFNDLKIDNIATAVTVKFDDSTTQTVSTFTASGTDGDSITLDTISGSNQFSLSKSSGVVECDYLSISNSNATGGATWYAGNNSDDTDNNDGWFFSDWTRGILGSGIIPFQL